MLRYFKYELKKNILPIIILTFISCLIYLAAIANANFVYYYPNGIDSGYETRGTSSLVTIPAIILCVLCTIVPVMLFSFKMNKRSVDGFYSLPLRREKIYLVKSLIGLILIFVPYITSYWLGFIATAIKPNLFSLVQFIPLFFISIPLAVLLFGINSFAFTRANRYEDGIIFIAMFAFLFVVLIEFIFNIFPTRNIDSSYWFTYSPIIYTFSKYNSLISKTGGWSNYAYVYEWLLYLFAGLTGVACWFGLFFTLKKEKAENAEQNSTSWFGYRTMIPAYMVLVLSLLDFSSYLVLYYVFILVAGIILYIMYRRTFKLKLIDWMVILLSIVLGLLLSMIPPLIEIPQTIYPVVSNPDILLFSKFF